MKQLTLAADIKNLDQVLAFVHEQLKDSACSPKAKMQLDVAVEEIFVNIAHYAYPEGSGDVILCCEQTEDPKGIRIRFKDRGIPYDPLAKEDPDITLSAEDRAIGGLGIYMVKEMMDTVDYVYQDGQNIFSMEKHF